MNRPLLAVTICFALGILLHSLYAVELKLLFTLTLAACCLALVGHALAWRETGSFILLLFVLLGWLWAGVEVTEIKNGPERFAGHYVKLEGTVTREPRYDGAGDVLYVLAAEAVYLGENRMETAGLVQVKVKGDGPVYGYGERLQAGGFVYLPREPGNFGAFNYRDYLERRGIRCLITVKGPEHVRALGSGNGNPLVALALGCKDRLMQVAGTTLDQHQAAVLSGMLFGNRDGLDRATSDVFTETGVAHVTPAVE